MTCSLMLLSWHKPWGHLCLESLGLQDTQQQPLSAACTCPAQQTEAAMLSDCEEPAESLLDPLGRSSTTGFVLEAERQCTVEHVSWLVAQHEHMVRCRALLEHKGSCPLQCFSALWAECRQSCSPAVYLNTEALLR